MLVSFAWSKQGTLQFWSHEYLMEEIRLFNQARPKTSYISLPRPAAIFDLAFFDQVHLAGQCKLVISS